LPDGRGKELNMRDSFDIQLKNIALEMLIRGYTTKTIKVMMIEAIAEAVKEEIADLDSEE